jgi:hypothetical protein
MTVDLSDSGSGIDETSIAVTVDDGTTTHLSSVGTGNSHLSYSNGTVTIDPTATTSFKLADGTTTATVDVGDNVGNTASTNWSFAVDAGSADGSTDWETPPEAPTNVSTNYIYEGYVDLSWTASTSSDVDGYRVYRNTSNDFSTAQELTSYVNPNTYWKDSTVATGTTYYYWVVAYDTEGLASDPSSVVSEAPIALETVFTNNGSAATGGGNSWGPELGELYYASDGKNLYLKLTWTTVGAGNKVYLAIDDQNQTSGVSTTGWGNLRVDLSSASFDADGVLWGARDGGGEFTTSGFNAITSGSETDKQSAITVDQNGDYSEYTIKIPYYAIGAGASSSNSIQVAAFFGKSVPNGGIHSSVPAPTSTTTGWLFSADVTDYSIAVDDNNLVRLIGGMNSWSTTNTDYSLVNQGNGVYNNMFVDGNVTSGQEFKWYISRDGGSNWEYQPGGSNPNLSVADSTTEVSKITGWIRSLDSAADCGTLK